MTPQELMDAARCFCFAEGMQAAVQNYAASNANIVPEGALLIEGDPLQIEGDTVTIGNT